jgi:prepilin-type N-terminal cleavage/methylation domain-containing protein
MVRCPPMRRKSPHRCRGFSLIELLAVLTIMALLVSAAVVGIRSINDSGKFNQALNNLAGVLEESRAYANAQDTYVWVVIYQNTPASGAPDVFVGSFASNDGTDPLNWAGSVTLPSPGTVGSTTLKAVTHFYHFKGLHLLAVTSTSPGTPTSPSPPASTPNFICTAPSDSGPVALSQTNPTYWVIQFTPHGAAHIGPNPISSIWLGLQPAYGATAVDAKNIASIEVNGLTGLSTIYRQ